MVHDEGPEIILNLWYVRDEDGFIYSLRAKAYVCSGPEDEKRTLLKTHADVDYLIARVFPVPRRYQTVVKSTSHSTSFPIAHVDQMDTGKSRIDLWEEAIQALNAEIPSQTELSMPRSPIVCVTPLLGDESGHVRPYYAATERW